MQIDALHLAYIDPGSGFVVGSSLGLIIAALVSCAGILLVFFRRHWRKLLLLLIVVLAGLGVFMAVNSLTSDQAGSLSGRRIVLLGLDGLSPEIIEPMLERGELPNMARLRDAGTYSRLKTTNPAQSPVAWAGFATGQNPGKHGVFDFILRDPQTYLPSISLTRHDGDEVLPARKGKALWNHTSERGIETVIIQCPVTFPPEDVHGRMLSGMGVPDLRGTQGTFAFYTTESTGRGRDTGGEVFGVKREQELTLELPGPIKAGLRGSHETVTASFRVTLHADRVGIKLGAQSTELAVGEWSDWLPVTFKMGPLKKMHGIVRFHLSELEPHLKLYASPVCIDPARPAYPISSPGSYAAELAERLGPFNTRGMPFDTWAVNEGRLDEKALLAQVDDIVAHKMELLRYEMDRFEEGVFFFYFEDSDILQHMFWRHVDERHPLHGEAVPEYASVVRDMYLRMDRIVGEILDGVDEGDAVLVFSDHGFTTFRRAAHINSWLVRNGYMKLAQGKTVGGDLLQDVDWSRTKAYAVGFGGIYINQAGREAQGVVAPGAETEALKREVREKLVAWSDDATGTPVADTVYTREEIFWGAETGNAPDLYIGFADGYRASWQTAIGGAPRGLIEDNLKKWSGDHLVDPKLIPGVLFANFAIAGAEPSIYDLCPTVLTLCGFDGEEIAAMDLDGKSLIESPAP